MVAVLVDPHLVDYDLVILVLTGLLIGATVPGGRWWLLGVYLALLGSLLFDVTLPFGGQLQPTVVVFAMIVYDFGLRQWLADRRALRLSVAGAPAAGAPAGAASPPPAVEADTSDDRPRHGSKKKR